MVAPAAVPAPEGLVLAGVTGPEAVAAAEQTASGDMDRGAGEHVVHVDTERTWGGGQRQLCALAVGMWRRGHPTWVVARPDTRLAAELAGQGVPVIPLVPTFEWDPVAALRLRALLREVEADLVHAHAAHAVAISALASVGTPVRLVVSRRVALPLRRNALSRWKYARATRFIAVSERVRCALHDSGVAPARIAVVLSGVDVACPIRRASEATLRQLGVDGRRPLVVMVSALIPPHKDPETFVAAVAAARAAGCDVQALLVGGGPLARSAERACRRLDLGGALRLTGIRSDAVELLAAADVAVLSSRDEGLGTSLLDAMLAGVPVVATAAGGVTEVVRDGVDGLLVPVGDGAALGAAIGRVLRDARLRAALVAAARERVKRFAIDRTVEGTLEVYRTMTPARSWRRGRA
jgi:glycosyltransferase involved in cell wall biosynthesis